MLDAGRLLLVPLLKGPARAVEVEGLPPGALPTGLRVSRDGARVALVVGGRLLVGRVERDAQGRLRVGGLAAVAPSLARIRDVVWESSSTLVVLARTVGLGWQPYGVSVDGAYVQAVGRLGVPGELESLAAAEGRPLVVGALIDGRPVLLRDNGRALTEVARGRHPAYPG